MLNKLIGLSSLLIGSASFNSFNKINSDINSTYHQIYVLGDSLSDTGELVGVVQTFFTSNYLSIYKNVEFTSPSYQHHNFCNGPVAVQVLAKKLNLSLTPGWDFNAVWNWEHFKKVGNNYAIGGAQFSSDNSLLGYFYTNRFSFNNEVNGLLSQHKIKNNDLVVLEAANNDLLSAIHNGIVNNVVTKKVTQIVNESFINETKVIKKLLQNNVNHLLITNVPNLSNVPEFVHSNSTKRSEISSIVKKYDDNLDNFINNLPKIQKLKIREYNLWNAFDKYLVLAKSMNFNTTEPNVSIDYASGLNPFKRKIEVNYYKGKNLLSFKRSFFYDEVHPSAWTDNLIGNDMFNLVKNWNNVVIK